MRQFFIPPEQIGKEEPELAETDSRHIHTVLRLGPGDRITVFDGAGGHYEARIVAADRRRVRIVLVRRLAAAGESPLDLVLAQGYLKDRKLDLMISPLTELGVTRLIPFLAHRSVPSPDEKRGLSRHQRRQRISQESVKQCRRSRPMTIEPVVSFDQALAMASGCELKLFFHEGQGGVPLGKTIAPGKPARVFILIGPEGGFEAAEQHAAERAGFISVRMGPRILRAETAALVACTLVQYLFGDIGENNLDKI